MDQKTYFLTTAIIFLIITVLHVLRLTLGWSAVIGGWEIPIWLSWIALILAGYLSYKGLKFSGKL